MNRVSGMAKRGIALVRPWAGGSRSSGHRFRLPSSIFGDDRGSALVEIAMVLPVFLALVTGMGSFAIAFNNQETLTQATGLAGQRLQTLRSTTTNPCADTFTALTDAAPTLNSASIGLTVSVSGTALAGGTTCSGDQTDLTEGAPVTVAATYPCNLSIYGITFATSCQLTAQVTEYEY